MRGDRLRVFVSSKMAELAAERAAVKEVLDELKIDAWVFEQDAGARTETIEETYKEQLRASDLYLGVFWKGYGEYTIDEFELARATDTDCLIYQKEGVRAEGRDPRLTAFLDRLGKVESGLTIQFFDTPEELREMVKRDTARWQTRIVRKYRAGGARPGAGAPADPNLAVLRTKVKQAWVEGVLGRAESDAGLVELAKESVPDAVERPLATGPDPSGEGGRAIDAGAKIAEIFESTGGSLLILGASGSGKTTTALELTRDLIARAERDDTRPVPVVLNLSTWSRRSRTLIGWIARELSGKYQVPEPISLPWLERDRLVLVLDGLDEVAAEQRATCAEAINRFVKEHGADRLVVTSRLQEYEALPVRLSLNGAIRLEPLAATQLEAYLEKAGEPLAGLRALLGADEPLRELASSPLMLGVMSRAYRDRCAEELEAGASDPGATRTEHLFRTYVERAFVEYETGRPYSRDATTSWLSWLARRMAERGRTLFLIEEMQPDWLSSRAQIGAYLLGLALSVGLVLGGLCVLYRLTPSALPGAVAAGSETVGAAGYAPPSAAESVGWIVACALFVFGIGVTDGPRLAGRETGADDARRAVPRIAANLAIFGSIWLPILLAQLLVWARAEGLGIAEIRGQLADAGAAAGAETAALEIVAVRFGVPAVGLVMGVAALAARRSFTRSIRTTESLRLERASATRGALWGLLGGGLFAALALAASGYHPASLFWLPAGSAFGAVLAGFRPRIVRGKAVPNQGIRLSIRSSLRAGRMAAPLAAIVPLACLILAAAGEKGYGEPALVAQWSVSALVFVFVCLAIWFGGLDVAKHYALRAVIGATRQGPWDFRRLLNYANRLKLTQRVGGGYMFLNRQLLDHFAAMSLPPPEADELRDREREDAGPLPMMAAVGALALAGVATMYAGIVAGVTAAIVAGSILLGLGALWLVIRTAVLSALNAARRDQEQR